MPLFLSGGEYDLAGFCVGIVKSHLDGSQVQVETSPLVGKSATMAFSLVRKIVDERGFNWSDCVELSE